MIIDEEVGEFVFFSVWLKQYNTLRFLKMLIIPSCLIILLPFVSPYDTTTCL